MESNIPSVPPEEEHPKPDETMSDYATRRIDPDRLSDPIPQSEAPEEDRSTRRLDLDATEETVEDRSTRRIDANQLFAALEPDPLLPGEQPEPPPPAGTTKMIDEPDLAPIDPVPSPEPIIPPPPEPAAAVQPPSPAAGVPSFKLPPTPQPPAGAQPPASGKKDNTLMIAAIAGIVLITMCAICACLVLGIVMYTTSY